MRTSKTDLLVAAGHHDAENDIFVMISWKESDEITY